MRGLVADVVYEHHIISNGNINPQELFAMTKMSGPN